MTAPAARRRTGWDLQAVTGDILFVLREVLQVLGRSETPMLDPLILKIINTSVRGAQAVHLRHVVGWSVEAIATRQGVPTSWVMDDLRIWDEGPAPGALLQLAPNAPQRGYLALITRHLRPTAAFQATYDTLASAFDAEAIRAHAAPNSKWSEDDMRSVAGILNTRPDLVDATEDHVVGSLRLLARRPLGRLDFAETAPDSLWDLARDGSVAGIDGTLLPTRDGLYSAIVVSVGYPANVATVVLGPESGATARRALRLVAHQLGGVPAMLVFDQHAAYVDPSFLRLVALLGIQPFHPLLIAQNPVEQINARLKAHLPDPDLITKDSLPGDIYQAWQATLHEPGRQGALARLRELSPIQRRLLDYDRFDLVNVNDGACDVYGQLLACPPCDPLRPLLLAVRGFDDERRSGPGDADLYDFGVEIAGTDGRPRLGRGLSHLTKIASPQPWLDEDGRHQEVVARLELPARRRLAEEATTLRPRRPPRRRGPEMADAGQGGAVALPLFPEAERHAAECRPPIDRGGVSRSASVPDSPRELTAMPPASAPTPAAVGGQAPMRSRRMIRDIPAHGRSRVGRELGLPGPYIDALRDWANECPWASALPVFVAHPDLRRLCSSTGLLPRAHPLRVLEDPSCGYGASVPISDGPDVYYYPARRRSESRVPTGAERALLAELWDSLETLRCSFGTERRDLGSVRSAIEVSMHALEVAVAEATRERLARTTAALERAELALQGGNVRRARGHLTYAQSQAPRP